MAKDYYQLLGVQRNATEAEIKKAFKRLAMKLHPDRNPDEAALEQFKQVKRAYDVLSDSQKRAAYDQFGEAGLQGAAGGGHGAAGFGGFEDMFGNIFDDLFGGGRSRGGRRTRQPQRGADLSLEMVLSLEEAVQGIKKQVKVPRLATCNECNGSGAEKGSQPLQCPDCEGEGTIRLQQGFFSVQQACPTCQGGGTVIGSPCKGCRGQGRLRETKELAVTIPPGVDNGDRIRLAHEGEAGTLGGVPGDLYVLIRLKEHDIFQRDGDDLHCEVPINFVTAALGGELEVPTLEGRLQLKIPPETQTGKLFRLRGKGVKSVRSRHVGDLICRIYVETPVKLSRKQKEALQKFSEVLNEDKQSHSPKERSWFDRAKRFFEEMKF